MKIRNLTAGTTVGDLEQAKARIAELEAKLAERDAPPTERCVCGHSRGSHITAIHGRPLGKCAASGCKCSGFVAPTKAGSYHGRVMSIEASIEWSTGNPGRDYILRHAAAEIAAEADARIADLEAQLRGASERAAANASNTEWVDRAVTDAAEALAAQKEEYEAKLAEANATIGHLRKAKNCYYDCVDKADANKQIAEGQKVAWEIVRPIVEKAEAEAARAGRDFQVARDAFDKSEVENARLRTALEAVEWVYDASHGPNAECPWCRELEYDGHKYECPRQAALRPQESEGK